MYSNQQQDSSIDLVLFLDTLHQLEDCDALFLEIHRVLKQNGLLFMDPGHMKLERARGIVEATGLFTIAECRDHYMMVVPKAPQ